METKSFKEIVPIKKSSSGPTNSAKQAVTPQINACLRGFFSKKINLDISLYLTVRSQVLCVAVLRTVGEYVIYALAFDTYNYVLTPIHLSVACIAWTLVTLCNTVF